MHGLDRVDDEHLGPHLVEVGDQVGQRRVGREPQPVGQRAEPLGPELHLRTRLLGRHVEHGGPAAGPRRGHLQQERGLADAGLTAEQRDRARHEPAAQHPVELGHPGRRGAPTRRASTRPIGMRRPAPAGPSAAAAGAVARSSPSVFHAPQPGQRPVHCGAAAPHSLHRNTVLVRPM